MELIFHDGRKVASPGGGTLDEAFEGLSDPGHFLILRDAALGEVRAAGPSDGTFLLQCDLSAPGGMFRGEVDAIERSEAASVFKSFAAGDTRWSAGWERRDRLVAPPPMVRGALLGLALLGALLLVLRLLRTG